MGRQHLSTRTHVGSLQKDILEQLTLGDHLYAFLLSARSTRRYYKLARERAAYRYRRKRAIERLIESEFIERRSEKLRITPRGRNAIGDTIHRTKRLLDTKKWDGKWRIATFDIPERYSTLRNKVRGILKSAGFVKLQQSLWIFPHDCEELVQLIKEESQLSKYILYGVLDRIEDEQRLKTLFKLS